MTDASGTTNYAYDTNSHVTSVDGPFASDTLSYTYDGLGRRTTQQVNATDTVTYAYDALNRLSSIAGVSGTFTYAYNGDTSLLSSLTLPNTATENYSYDSLERLTQVQNLQSDGVTNISKYTYHFNNSTNREVRISLDRQFQTNASQHIDYGYDAVDELTGAVSVETPPLEKWAYGYDAMGGKTSLDQNGGRRSEAVQEPSRRTRPIGSRRRVLC